MRLRLHAAADVIRSPTKLQLKQCISYLWISSVEFFPPVVILQISHCYCALIWPITARTRRSVSRVLIDRHLCLSNAGSSGASQMIFFFPLLNKPSYSVPCLSLWWYLSPRALLTHTRSPALTAAPRREGFRQISCDSAAILNTGAPHTLELYNLAPREEKKNWWFFLSLAPALFTFLTFPLAPLSAPLLSPSAIVGPSQRIEIVLKTFKSLSKFLPVCRRLRQASIILE